MDGWIDEGMNGQCDDDELVTRVRCHRKSSRQFACQLTDGVVSINTAPVTTSDWLQRLADYLSTHTTSLLNRPSVSRQTA